MAILVTENTGKGDEKIKELLSPEMEAGRMALRRQLIAARGSSYTYKDPDTVAQRTGANIGDDGTITIGMNRSQVITSGKGKKKGRSGSYAGDRQLGPSGGGDDGRGGGMGAGGFGRTRMAPSNVGRGSFYRSFDPANQRESIFDKIKAKLGK